MRCAVGFSSRSKLRLDISSYDRTPSLTKLELAAMGRIRRSGNPGWTLVRQREDLFRLVKPLEAARVIICSDLKKAPRRQYPLAGFFVLMQQEGKIFLGLEPGRLARSAFERGRLSVSGPGGNGLSAVQFGGQPER